MSPTTFSHTCIRLTEPGCPIPSLGEIHSLLTLVFARKRPGNTILRPPLFPRAREDFAVRSVGSRVSWRLAFVQVVGDLFEAGLEFLLGGKIERVFRGEAIGVLRQGEFDEGAWFLPVQGFVLIRVGVRVFHGA